MSALVPALPCGAGGSFGVPSSLRVAVAQCLLGLPLLAHKHSSAGQLVGGIWQG